MSKEKSYDCENCPEQPGFCVECFEIAYINLIATDNDNNKPGTSLLRVDLSPERKAPESTRTEMETPNFGLPTPLADFQAVNTPVASIQVPDVEVAATLAANLQGSKPEVPDTQLADTQPANTHPADTKITSPKKREKKRVAVTENWLSNKAKKLRNSDQAYTSRFTLPGLSDLLVEINAG
ncbi:unnamed protein product [Diabrotica balteata]|uniref:Uncharacterized protein n=1 Tax=Diabrotica balteata TaxID=107213 RepID=A0A9N9T0C2_DIABA|nr:unnamed protein product [Diabrotica balteata]